MTAGGRAYSPGRLLLRFLRDRLGWILLAYVLTAMVLALLSLLLAPLGEAPSAMLAQGPYALLLATTLLLIYLGVELVRWWPFARQVQRLLAEEVDLTALANLPPGGTLDQADFAALVAKLYGLSVAERLRYQQAHQRHLAFINMWVHQMKTPVSGINLVAQEAAAQAPEELPAAMQTVAEETRKLTDGLELVLHMARLSDFAVDYRIERTDLLDSVRRVINGRKKQFIRLGIFPEVEAADGGDASAGVDTPQGAWTVLTDEKWNRFVIDQIVANALKYAGQAGPRGQRLTFRLERRSNAIALTIADQGPGIPPADLARVFEPFFTGANGRRFAEATGIGLWLVRQVVDQLDHAIAIESTVGQGTRVTLTYQAGVFQS